MPARTDVSVRGFTFSRSANARHYVSITVLERSHPRRRCAPPSRRPVGRLLGAGALVVSVFLHGGAAAVALLVLPHVMPRANPDHQEEPPALVDLDVVTPANPEAELRSAPLLDAPVRPTSERRSRSAPARTPVLHARRLVPMAPDDAKDVAPTDEHDRASVPRFSLSAGIIAGRSDLPVEASAQQLATERAALRQSGTLGGFLQPPAKNSAGQSPASFTGSEATNEDTRPLAESAVDAPARLATAGQLVYPEAARRAELEVDLPLELIVSPQGRVLSATALAHPGYGLENAALAAVRSYVFHPAHRAGRRVPVRMKWMMQFRLR